MSHASRGRSGAGAGRGARIWANPIVRRSADRAGSGRALCRQCSRATSADRIAKDVPCQPVGGFGCQEVPGGARMLARGHIPRKPPGDPLTQMARCAKRHESRPARRHGTARHARDSKLCARERPPQSRRAAETTNGARIARAVYRDGGVARRLLAVEGDGGRLRVSGSRRSLLAVSQGLGGHGKSVAGDALSSGLVDHRARRRRDHDLDVLLEAAVTSRVIGHSVLPAAP